MKRFLITFAAVMATAMSVPALAEEVEDYSSTIGKFKANPTASPYFGSAYGYAVLPNIGKGGVGVGGAYGKGQVYRGGGVTGFVSMSQLSFGLQLGGQSYSQVIFFEDQRAYDDFTSGNFEFSADASAVAITASAQASAGTTGTGASAGTGGTAGTQVVTDYQKGMKIFTIAKGGLMYEAAIAGQKYKYTPLQ
jgi:lipid-binding SYLF domain-containing protein